MHSCANSQTAGSRLARRSGLEALLASKSVKLKAACLVTSCYCCCCCVGSGQTALLCSARLGSARLRQEALPTIDLASLLNNARSSFCLSSLVFVNTCISTAPHGTATRLLPAFPSVPPPLLSSLLFSSPVLFRPLCPVCQHCPLVNCSVQFPTVICRNGHCRGASVLLIRLDLARVTAPAVRLATDKVTGAIPFCAITGSGKNRWRPRRRRRRRDPACEHKGCSISVHQRYSGGAGRGRAGHLVLASEDFQ